MSEFGDEEEIDEEHGQNLGVNFLQTFNKLNQLK
jgi:hypothetical protein